MKVPDFSDRRFVALASDYDGTLAKDGKVSASTLAALNRFKACDGRIVLVTGRVLPELEAVFPDIGVCDLVVAENGALLFWPKSGEVRLLAPPPPPAFAERLAELGAEPLTVGRCIVATRTPYEVAVLKTIEEMHLDLSIIFNKGAVMVLPSGVSKATGLEAALKALDVRAEETIGVGDAENDLAMLKMCGLGVAVANALDTVKAAADWVTPGARGDGVAQALDALMSAEARL
ncbi:MAG TPA: HAD-IIB family hydrolase [Roseiarcus sp.]|nr:HAD-IIB family hydrolase [Roseiarcus sp.]